MNPIKYISKKVGLAFHKQLIVDYSGLDGLRDEGLLESALAQPESTMFGAELHHNVFEMAAAYGYHLCQNHPFVDGNKRIAFVVMDTFLRINGWEVVAEERAIYTLMLALASGQIDKPHLAQWLRENCMEECSG
jgi:death-on-curing protein